MASIFLMYDDGTLQIKAKEIETPFNYSEIYGFREGSKYVGWAPNPTNGSFKQDLPRYFTSANYASDYIWFPAALTTALLNFTDADENVLILDKSLNFIGELTTPPSEYSGVAMKNAENKDMCIMFWGYSEIEDPEHPGQMIPITASTGLNAFYYPDASLSYARAYNPRLLVSSTYNDVNPTKMAFWIITVHDDVVGSVTEGDDFRVLVQVRAVEQLGVYRYYYAFTDMRLLAGTNVNPPSKSTAQGNTPNGFRGGRDDHSDSDTISTIGTGLDTAFVNTGTHGVKLYRINAASSGVGVPSQYDDLYNCFWSENFWDKYRNAKWSPLSGVISLHMMPCDPTDADGRTATFTTNQQINVAGQELSYVAEPGPPLVEIHARGDVPDHSKAQICTKTFHPLEYSHSFLDWGANTRARLRLPFIGVVPVEISKVMEGGLFAKYNIDFLTGNCLVQVYTVPSKDVMGEEGDWDEDYGGCICLIAEYSGNCAQKLNFAGNDYGGNYAAGYVGGIASTALSHEREGVENFVNHMGYSIVGGYLDYRIRSKHHIYNIPATANVSTMGMMIPALIIDRPIDITPLDEKGRATVFESFNGRPAASGGTVKDYKSFDTGEGIFIKGVLHADTLYATESEKKQIEQAFAKGVYL